MSHFDSIFLKKTNNSEIPININAIDKIFGRGAFPVNIEKPVTEGLDSIIPPAIKKTPVNKLNFPLVFMLILIK